MLEESLCKLFYLGIVERNSLLNEEEMRGVESFIYLLW